MKDENQLVLFFRKGTNVDNTLLASKLKEKFEILKDPIVIPKNEKNLNQPLVIFNQGDLKLTIGNFDVSFVYNEKHKTYYDIIIDIVRCFENLDYSFERMGYIKSIFHTKKERDKFKENVFKDKEMIQSEFQLSWYKKELIDSVSVNVWHKEITDMINGVDLVSVFDINTPIDEVYYINSDFLDSFIKQCDKYIDIKDKELK